MNESKTIHTNNRQITQHSKLKTKEIKQNNKPNILKHNQRKNKTKQQNKLQNKIKQHKYKQQTCTQEDTKQQNKHDVIQNPITQITSEQKRK